MERSTDPTPCRSCQAELHWAKWLESGKAVPIDRKPHVNGNIVLTLKPSGALIAEKYDHIKHAGRNRYVSHFATCPEAGKWRGDR